MPALETGLANVVAWYKREDIYYCAGGFRFIINDVNSHVLVHAFYHGKGSSYKDRLIAGIFYPMEIENKDS